MAITDQRTDAGAIEALHESFAAQIQLDEDGAVNRETRQMPLSLVIDPPQELGVVRDEIFGPILPVRPYDSVDDAVDYVNSQERPLGLYVMARDEDLAEDVLRRTTSGGATVNACAMQGAMPSLNFGGVGQSGTGRHHGIDGFREFSNPRGVFIRGEGDLIDLFGPPYGEHQQALVDGALEAAGGA